ncbi:MAG: DUF2141 domain-containing protein [Thiobacillaceae bacterium]
MSPLTAHPADLEVAVTGVRNTDGPVKLMLFDHADGFRKENKARQVLALPARAGSVQGVFHDLPPGRYAVIAYHDEDGNGKLDLRFGMFPTEGYGLSNNRKVSGPPSFKEASFDLTDAGRQIDIDLDY